MIDHIVVDVEIQKTVNGPPDNLTWNDTDKLGVACAVVYEFRSDRFRVYGPEDVEVLKQRLLAADRVTGFNTRNFDFPVIWGLRRGDYVRELEPKSNDILREIWKALSLDPDVFSDAHNGWSLDNVVRGTLHAGVGKIGNGALAPVWFQRGEWCRLITYCLDDVTLERDLARFIDRHGYVVNGQTGHRVCL